jgi:hypothetical protein
VREDIEMAGERSDHNDPRATADQPPVEGEPSYQPVATPGGDVPGSDHEEPLDGAEPEPRG